MTDIDEVLARLNKKTLDKFRMGRDISKLVLPTASLGLNMRIGGGLGIGKQTTLFGNQSSGKSAFMLQTIGINQKGGRACGYIDAEKTFDYEWAERLGVDVDHLPVSQVSSISDMADVCSDWIHAGIELITVDSTSALMPESFYNKDGVVKAFEDTRQVGQFAKDLGQACRMVQAANFNAAFVCISQIRMDLGNSFMPGTKASGGKEVEHLDSLRIKMFSSKSEKQAITGQVQRGSQLVQETVGRTVTWTVDKNKINGRWGSGSYDLLVQGDEVGIDRAGEVLDYAIKLGLVDQKGPWIVIFDEKLQGRSNAIKYIKQHDDVRNKLEDGLAESL